MKKCYTEEQIIKATKQHEAVAKVVHFFCDMGILRAHFTTGAVSLQVYK